MALARTRGPITRLGLFLDPLADKLLIGRCSSIWDALLVVKIVVGLIAVARGPRQRSGSDRRIS